MIEMLPASLLFSLSFSPQNAPQTDILTLQNQATCLPQAVPFSATTRYIYGLTNPPDEHSVGGPAKAKQWTEFEVNGVKVGIADAVNEIKFSGRSNPVRAAWGMRYWGQKFKQTSWVDRADKMVNLILSAPGIEDDIPGGYTVSTKTWHKNADAQSAVEIAWSLRDYANSFPSYPQAKKASSAAESILKQNAAVISRPSSDPLFELNRLIRTGAPSSATSQAAAKLRNRMVRATTVWQRDVSILGSIRGESVGGNASAGAGLLLAGERQSTPEVFQDGVWVLRGICGFLKMQSLTLQGFDASTANAECRATLPFHEYEGFVAGEGMVGAAYAEADMLYGGFYTSHQGWSVGIDGVDSVNGQPLNVLVKNDIPYRGKFDIDWVKANGSRINIADPDRPKAFVRLIIQSSPTGDVIVAEPASSTQDGQIPSGSFVLADGRKLPAAIGPHGLQASVTANDLAIGPVSFVSSWNSIRPTNLLIAPDFRPTVWGTRGWMNRSQLENDPISSADQDGWISPSFGSSVNRSYARTVVSAEFTARGKNLTFEINGANGRVELVDALNFYRYNKTVQTKNALTSKVIWPIDKAQGRRVYVRIIDENRGSGVFKARGFRLK